MATRHKIAYTDKTFTDQTGSRALDTTYTNSDANSSMLVIVSFHCNISVAAGAAYVIAKSDASSPPTTAVSGKVGIENGLLNEDSSVQISFIVAPGKNYKLISTQTNGTVVIGFWGEMLF